MDIDPGSVFIFDQILWLHGKDRLQVQEEITRRVLEQYDLAEQGDDVSLKRKDDLGVEIAALKAGLHLVTDLNFVLALSELAREWHPVSGLSPPQNLEEFLQNGPEWARQAVNQTALRQAWERVNVVGLALMRSHQS